MNIALSVDPTARARSILPSQFSATRMLTAFTLASAPPERSHFDGSGLGHRMARGDLDRLLEAAAVDQVEAADRFLRLRKRTVGDDRLAVAHADRAATARWSELVAGLPDPAGGEVVHPRKRLVLGSRARGGLRLLLAVHAFRVPTDQQ